MREILFRGKLIKNGKWVYGLVWKKKYNDGNRIFISYFPDKDDGEECDVVYLETVGEYTGLTDKNDNKIFEGDIHENNGNKYVVKYGSCYDCDRECNYFGWYFEDINNKEWCECFDGTESKYVNIIGNIHDNPELLKKDSNDV